MECVVNKKVAVAPKKIEIGVKDAYKSGDGNKQQNL